MAVEAVEIPLAPPAENAERAGMGVDQADADVAAAVEAEIFGSRAVNAAEIGGDRARAVGSPPRSSMSAMPIACEEIVRPAGRLVGEIGPFAGQRALRAGRSSPVAFKVRKSARSRK